MTYAQSAHGKVITHERALRELRDHHCNTPADVDEFYDALGVRDEYKASDVLAWLGY